MNESEKVDSWDCEDSIDIPDGRGERGKENLIELKRLPLFGLLSSDLLEEMNGGDGERVTVEFSRNKEKAGRSVRGWAVLTDDNDDTSALY